MIIAGEPLAAVQPVKSRTRRPRSPPRKSPAVSIGCPLWGEEVRDAEGQDAELGEIAEVLEAFRVVGRGGIDDIVKADAPLGRASPPSHLGEGAAVGDRARHECWLVGAVHQTVDAA